MVKKVDLTGQRFGKLVVLSEVAERDKGWNVWWECLCDCGKKSKVRMGSLRNGDTTTCGCSRSENIVGNRYGNLTVMRKTEKRINKTVVWECQCDCGNICEVSTRPLKSGNRKSCGCLIKRTGENHPRYNPNLTDEERFNKRGHEHIMWSQQVLSDDNYTCQICNQLRGNLNAHHLNGWNAFPEQRFDLDNGVTLCTDCHKEFHSEYGYGDNTREQFDEYAVSKTLVLN